MSRYLIADFVAEFDIKYNRFKKLAEPFLLHRKLPEIGRENEVWQHKSVCSNCASRCSINRQTDFSFSVSQNEIEKINAKMLFKSGIEGAEEFAYSKVFNRAIIPYGGMLIHSSAILVNGGAYLFSGVSGLGKSTHTRLWTKAFGNEVEYINDDKPVVRIYDDKCIAFGTPFDGGSGIANNIFAPLKAVIFLERSQNNEIRKADKREVAGRLYQNTIHSLDKSTAEHMLKNFDKLISMTDFYILNCNTDISSAYVAREGLKI